MRIARAFAAGLLAAAALPSAAGAGECPGAEATAKALQQVFKQPIEVKKITPSPVKGMCEVQVSFRGRGNVLYVDPTGEYFVTGHIVEVKSGKDLSEETIGSLNSLSKEDMGKLASLTAMTLGKGGKVVYFATDPQ